MEVIKQMMALRLWSDQWETFWRSSIWLRPDWQDGARFVFLKNHSGYCVSQKCHQGISEEVVITALPGWWSELDSRGKERETSQERGRREIEDRGWSTGGRQDAVFKILARGCSLPHVSHALHLSWPGLLAASGKCHWTEPEVSGRYRGHTMREP